MLQARMMSPGLAVIEQAECPIPSEGQALVAVRSCGICGSDLLSYKGLNPFVKYPYVFGHELMGEVVSVPTDAGGISVGQRVVIVPFAFCGRCRNCLAGRENLCSSISYLGGLAEYVPVPVASIVPIPDEMASNHAALAEPVAVGVHAVSRSGLKDADNVLIFGAGAVGLCVLQVARAEGAARAIVVDLSSDRLRIAEKLGATDIIDASQPGAATRIAELASNTRIDVIFECAGAAPALETSVAIAEKGRKIVVVGTFSKCVTLQLGLLQYREVDLLTCSSYVVEDFRRAIRLIRDKRVDTVSLLSKTISLGEVPAMLDSMAKDAEKFIKVVTIL